jgi:hypothetical protein
MLGLVRGLGHPHSGGLGQSRLHQLTRGCAACLPEIEVHGHDYNSETDSSEISDARLSRRLMRMTAVSATLVPLVRPRARGGRRMLTYAEDE